MGALEPGALGDTAHVALLLAEQLLEVDALECLARLAQRQLKKPRGQPGATAAGGRKRILAKKAPDVFGRDLAADGQREIGDDAVQVIEIPGPVRRSERSDRAAMQRGLRPLACRYLAPETLDQRRDILAPLAQWRQHHRPGGQRGQQRSVEASIGGKIGELLAARADQDRTVLLELRQEKREPFLLRPRVAADLAAQEQPFPRLFEQLQRVRGKPGATLQCDERRFGKMQRAGGHVVARPGSPTMRIGRPARSNCSIARSASITGVLVPSAESDMRRGPWPRPVFSARVTVVSNFCNPTGFSRKSKAPILVASTAVSIVP